MADRGVFMGLTGSQPDFTADVLDRMLRGDSSFVPARGSIGSDLLTGQPMSRPPRSVAPVRERAGLSEPADSLHDLPVPRSDRPGMTTGRGLTPGTAALPPSASAGDPDAVLGLPATPNFDRIGQPSGTLGSDLLTGQPMSRPPRSVAQVRASGDVEFPMDGSDTPYALPVPPPFPRSRQPGMTTGQGLTADAALLPPAVQTDGAATPPVDPARAIVAGRSPAAQAVASGTMSPQSEAAYDPETGTRDEETRKLGLLDRLFGEPGEASRREAGKAIMLAGATIMSTSGSIGEAIGAGIQAGLTTYDESMRALRDEEKEARQMGMAEEAHQLSMEVKRLQLARAQRGPDARRELTTEEKLVNAASILEEAFTVQQIVAARNPGLVEALGGEGQATRAIAANSGMRFPGNLPQNSGDIFGMLE